ncbi:MAG: outer membrane protein transport protein [Leptolyngbyaceae cyanobacterium MO_188.B28]|nr:outer membrane protein transport protein [Leptolyngbyaceae cyanobacterium MO_188.B28]
MTNPLGCKGLAVCLSLLGSGVLLADSAIAGGFSYAPEANPTNPAGSQGAAGLDDASAVFYNPAALMRLEGSQIFIRQDLTINRPKFKDNGSELFPGVPLSGGDASGSAEVLVPSFSASYRISEDVAIGASIDAPFGLATLYSDDWPGRYQAIETRLSTININPAIAANVTDDLAVGIGVNLQYADAVLTNAIDFGSLIALGGAPPVPQQLDGQLKLQGDDWSWGWNAGILYEPTDTTRIGLAYRSAISHDLSGPADFTVPEAAAGLSVATGGAFTDTEASARLDFPDILSFGVYQQLTPQLAMTGQVDWQNWSRFSDLSVDFDNPAQPDTTEPQNWHDTFRFAVGAIYQPSNQWTIRAGVAYDPSPVEDAFLNPRIPSSDSIGLDLGATYRPTNNLGLTARWYNVFFTDREIERTVPNAGTLAGEYNTHVDVFSFVLDWKF